MKQKSNMKSKKKNPRSQKLIILENPSQRNKQRSSQQVSSLSKKLFLKGQGFLQKLTIRSLRSQCENLRNPLKYPKIRMAESLWPLIIDLKLHQTFSMKSCKKLILKSSCREK